MKSPRPALSSAFPVRRVSLLRKLLRATTFLGLPLFAILNLPAPVLAWGCEGHQVIALLAEKHLTPHALAMANQVLAADPIAPNLSRYCKEGGIDAIADASTWADDVRSLRPHTSPWHYVDIHLGTTRREVEKFCDPKEGCVTRAITDELAILRSAGADDQKRADALRFLIHFVGDLHQPLHAASNNDQGGNCVPVAFFDLKPQLRNPQTESYAPNLHGVWDTNILAKATPGMTVDQAASDLDHSFQGKIAHWKRDKLNVNGWAWESHQIAVKTVYGKLPARVPVETPQEIKSCADDNHVSARMLKLDERIEAPYQDKAAPIVRQQVAKAGAHLALILNQLWP
jgi:hypothetical protein